MINLHDMCLNGENISNDDYITAPVFLFVLLLGDFESVPSYNIRQMLELFVTFYVSYLFLVVCVYELDLNACDDFLSRQY